MKKALVVGIDDYPSAPLNACVNDAIGVAGLLERNGDGSPNFSVRTITSNQQPVSCELLHTEIARLFRGDAEIALFYFAGHGLISPDTNAGYIVCQDGKSGAWGISLGELVGLANGAYPRIKSSVIMLDCCHAGFAGRDTVFGPNTTISHIGNGVTILTACPLDGLAADGEEHGLFTELLLDGLSGSAADICGRITPAAVYSHIDQTLGPWEQRPIYKANVQSFVVLRSIAPKILLETLRRLPYYFPDATDVFALDPSYEPDRNNIPEALRHLPVDEEHTRTFKDLQACNRQGLVVPVDAPHMYDAAIQSTGCRLTAMGAHYRKLAELGRI